MTDTEFNSRNIPLPIQREVRQRCGFGCVICGLPLYEYEHMEEWALVKRHIADEITLLCDKHHREKTGGLLPKSIVAKANLEPFNLKKGVSPAYNLHFTGSEMAFKLGRCIFSKDILPSKYHSVLTGLMINGIPIVSFSTQNGHLLLTVNIFDNENKKILEIIDNQLFYSTKLWDIQLIRTTLTIREGLGDIFIEFKFHPPCSVEITRGKIYCNNHIVEISQGDLFLNGKRVLSGISVHNADIAVAIGEENLTGFCGILVKV